MLSKITVAMRNKFIIFFTCTILGFCAQAQLKIPAHISSKLIGDNRFYSFSYEMTKYLDSILSNATDSSVIKAARRQYKFLARHLYYLENHQDAEGKIVNATEKNFDALSSVMRQPALNASTNGNWTRVGPDHVQASYGNRGIGRVDRIAFHPSNEDIIYAGTPAGGLFRTTTGGTIWSNLNNYIPSLGISGIVVSYANPSVLYVLTGDGDSNIGEFGFVEGFNYIRPSVGVLKSTDEGQTWVRTNLNIPGFYVGYKLIQSPSDENVLLAATSKGLYRTANGGSSWDRVSADSSRFFDIEWKPGSSAQVYATTANKLYISVSAGQTWADITNRIPESISNFHRIALAVTPANTGMLYVLASRDPSLTSTTYKVFRSSSSASVFAKVYDVTTSEGSALYMLNIAASPTNHLSVVFGGLRCYFSEDGCQTIIRSSVNDDAGSNRYVHSDVHELNYNPLNSKLFIGCDGGVYSSSDHGVSTFGHYLGLSATQYYHVDIDETNTDFMIAGAQDNGIMLKDDNTSFFKNYKEGDGFDISYPHGYGSSVLVTVNTNTYALVKNFPSNFWVVNLQDNVWYKPVSYSYYDSSKYIGGLTKILKWVSFGGSIGQYDGNGRWALTVCRSNSSRLYAAGGPEWNSYGENSGKNFIRSEDNAVTWTSLKNNPGFPDTISKINSIAVHPNNSSSLYFVMGGYIDGQKVFYSSNAGASWENRTGNLPNIPVNCVAIQNNGDAYIGTDIGVFYRPSAGTDWIPFFNGLPKLPVTDLKIVLTELYASTFGRGIWKTDLAQACPSSLNITSNQSGRVFYEAGSITSTAQLVDGAGTEIYMKAQTQTVLSPGFRANANTGEEFRSWVSNCGAGGVPLKNELSNLESWEGRVILDSSILHVNLPYGVLATFIAMDEGGGVTGDSYEVFLQANDMEYKIPPVIKHPQLLILIDGKKAGLAKYTSNGYHL
jgi:hypothetical protein